MLPDFLGIGAQRCGTTWLYENLRAHPEIFMPDKKELNFFSEINGNYAKGLPWYENYFKDASPTDRKGEITPEYLLDPSVPGRIIKALDTVKVIAILRNPLDRALSSYGKGLREGNWDIGFDEFTRTNRDYCIDRGKYYRQLLPFFERWPKENILIKIYEDIAGGPQEFLKDIYRFLRVNSNFVSSQVDHKFNIGVSKKGGLLTMVTFTRDAIYRTPFKGSIKWLQRNRQINSVMNRLMSARKDVTLYPEWLKKEFYDDAAKLSQLLNRNLLSEWGLKNE